jgi:uncharacterized protein
MTSGAGILTPGADLWNAGWKPYVARGSVVPANGSGRCCPPTLHRAAHDIRLPGREAGRIRAARAATASRVCRGGRRDPAAPVATGARQERFENYDPDAASLSDADARLLIANQEGYANWGKYESYLHLDPAVQRVIVAVRSGDIETLRDTLDADPAAANPRWVAGFHGPTPIPNDSIPLFCISEGVFRGTNTQHNACDLTRMLVVAGADIHIEGDIVLESAVSFEVIDAVAGLLDGGAAIDGVDGDGVPMAYAMHFGFVEVAELLGRRGAKRDLRFAAGLGELDVVKSWFDADSSLKPGAGALADPYGQELKQRGQSPFRCERTRPNILSQALCFACVHNRLEVADFLLAQGADINAIVPGLDMKATVLHRVASADGRFTRSQIEAAIPLLLDRGADPAIRDEVYHSTPIVWASLRAERYRRPADRSRRDP